MTKTTNKIAAILLGLAAIYLLIMVIRRNAIDGQIEKKGYYVTGIIVKEFVSKGSTKSFTYTYKCYGNKYQFESYVDDSYFERHQLGDTIVIRILPDDPSQSNICEDISYKKCFGKQPIHGWKKLPSCK